MNRFSTRLFIAFLFVGIFGTAAFAQDPFPHGPDATMTPGTLCTTPDTFRYPEHVAYCKRDVDPNVKNLVMRQYDQKLGYTTTQMPRGDFKIDHYIPLCAGGSNEASNLWPQHKSIYAVTDPLEPLVCTKMQAGVLLQKDAVELIKQGKNDLSQVPAIIAHLNSL